MFSLHNIFWVIEVKFNVRTLIYRKISIFYKKILSIISDRDTNEILFKSSLYNERDKMFFVCQTLENWTSNESSVCSTIMSTRVCVSPLFAYNPDTLACTINVIACLGVCNYLNVPPYRMLRNERNYLINGKWV